MAISSSWILSLKVLLISTGVVSIALMVNFSVPLITHFLVYKIPLIWSTLITLLRPPYLYFIINGIIITIVATSRFHHKLDDKHESEPLVESKPPPTDLQSSYAAVSTPPEFGVVGSSAVYESEAIEKTVVINGDSPVAQASEQDEAFVIPRSTWTPPQRINSSEIDPEYLMQPQEPEPELELEYLMPEPEKPLVSSRFGHRKPLKVSPEGGRALRVAKPKRRQETLETTWKTITDGRHVPLTRHLRKSDTWENHGRQFNTGHSPPQIVLKSETFRDRTNYDPPPTSSTNSSPGSGKLRKEPSLGQDELNRRVEAFIKKFNDEMRLQRQESLNQYKEMLNRGAH